MYVCMYVFPPSKGGQGGIKKINVLMYAPKLSKFKKVLVSLGAN